MTFKFTFIFFIIYSSNLFSQQYFIETFGSVSSTTTIGVHQNLNAFDNKIISFAGSGTIQNTNASPGGGANLLLNNQFIELSGFDSKPNAFELEVSFLAQKAIFNEDLSSLVISFSYDGTTFTDDFNLELFEGTNWEYYEVIIPLSQANLKKIKLANSGTFNIHIDDLKVNSLFDDLLSYSLVYNTLDNSPAESCILGSLRGAIKSNTLINSITFLPNINSIKLLYPITIEYSTILTGNFGSPFILFINSAGANMVINYDASLELNNFKIVDEALNNDLIFLRNDGQLTLKNMIFSSQNNFLPYILNTGNLNLDIGSISLLKN